MTVSLAPVTSSFQQLRIICNDSGKDFWAEYCYHMVSLMIETEKVFNGQGFSPRYIEEHCNYIIGYAKEIAREEGRDLDR